MTARLADFAPWVLAAYGTYLSSCWLRTACAGESAQNGGGAIGEAVVGAGVIMTAVVLHQAWRLSETQRVAGAVLVLVLARLLLSPEIPPVAGRPLTAGAGALVVALAVSTGVRRALRVHQYSASPEPSSRSVRRRRPNNDIL